MVTPNKYILTSSEFDIGSYSNMHINGSSSVGWFITNSEHGGHSGDTPGHAIRYNNQYKQEGSRVFPTGEGGDGSSIHSLNIGVDNGVYTPHVVLHTAYLSGQLQYRIIYDGTENLDNVKSGLGVLFLHELSRIVIDGNGSDR